MRNCESTNQTGRVAAWIRSGLKWGIAVIILCVALRFAFPKFDTSLHLAKYYLVPGSRHSSRMPLPALAHQVFLAALYYEKDQKKVDPGSCFERVPTLETLTQQGYMTSNQIEELKREYDISFYSDSSQIVTTLPQGQRMFIKIVRRKDQLTVMVTQDGEMSYSK